MLTRPEIRVRREIGGNERLDDDTECPKRQPKHRESENNKQEWMERSALPAGLFRGSIAALGGKLCNPVIPERHLRSCQRMRNQSPRGRLYSLPSPGLAMACEAVSGDERKLEALCDFGLDEDGCPLIALIGVFFVDSRVVLLWVVAAFKDGG